jgi:hypothetical protein
MVGRLGNDLDPVVECHTENEFWQLVTPTSLHSRCLAGIFSKVPSPEVGSKNAWRAGASLIRKGQAAFSAPISFLERRDLVTDEIDQLLSFDRRSGEHVRAS